MTQPHPPQKTVYPPSLLPVKGQVYSTVTMVPVTDPRVPHQVCTQVRSTPEFDHAMSATPDKAVIAHTLGEEIEGIH